MSYKLAIFDFDGTLVDSAPGIVQCMKDVVEELGFKQELLQQWQQMIGVPLLRQMELLFPEKDTAWHEDLANRYRAKYDSKAIEICPLFPHMKDMLVALRKNNLKVTIATSKRRHLVDAVLQHHQLEHHFDMVVGASDVTHHKPHPESVHLIIDRMRIPHAETVVIGDSTFDLDMARNAGVDAIGVTTGVHTHDLLQKSSPRHVVDGLDKVTPLILNGRAI